MDNIVIEMADKEDADFICACNCAMALETENKVLPNDVVAQGVRALLDKPEYGFYVIARYQGQNVGTLMVTAEWSDWRNGAYWWIQSVYIVPEFRRQGIYRQLYNFVKEQAASRSDVCGFRLYVEKDNVTAQQTYETLGMTESHYVMFEEEQA